MSIQNKIVCISGVSGQLGSHLVDYYLEKNYKVVGTIRRSSTNNLWRIAHNLSHQNFTLDTADLTDYSSFFKIFQKYHIDYFINCAAQSFVHTSFSEPIHTINVTGTGVVNLLEIIRTFSPHTRFINLASSEMFGSRVNFFGCQNEQTEMLGNSPYAVAKLLAFNMTKIYRDAYNLFCASAICFNMEGPRRGEEFISRKITKYVASFYKNPKGHPPLLLGRISSKRDWQFAGDVCEGIDLMLNQEKPDDFVFGTGEVYSVEDLLSLAFKEIGIQDWQPFVKIDPSLFRAKEVPYLKSDPDKAKKILGWTSKIKLPELVKMMVEADIAKG